MAATASPLLPMPSPGGAATGGRVVVVGAAVVVVDAVVDVDRVVDGGSAALRDPDEQAGSSASAAVATRTPADSFPLPAVMPISSPFERLPARFRRTSMRDGCVQQELDR